jgi:putative DNA primase/helicase
LVDDADYQPAEVDYVVEGLVEARELSAIIGPPKSGKTGIVMRLVWSITTGTPFKGRKVMSGRVLYILGEGGNGIRNRKAAIERLMGKAMPSRSLVTLCRGVNLTDPSQLQALITFASDLVASDGIPIVLLVVDTMARSMVGRDENSARDVGMLVDAIGAVSRALNCASLLVHHTGKDVSRNGRGSNALEGAVNGEALVTRNKKKNQIKFEVRHLKESEEPAPISFSFQSVEVGTKKDGSPMMAQAAIEDDRSFTDDEEDAGSKPSALQQRVFDFLKGSGVPRSPKDVGDALELARAASVNEALAALVKKGFAEKVGRGLYAVTTQRATNHIGKPDAGDEEDLFHG